MTDYVPHPNDTLEFQEELAIIALAKARPTNRFYIFPMQDRVEIAFGNSRHLMRPGPDGNLEDGEFSMEFFTAISIDQALLKDFVQKLSTLVDGTKEANG